MSINDTTLDYQFSHDTEKLVIVLAYAFITIIMFIPYCFSLYVIQRNKSIYDQAFRLFALNMGFSDLQLMVLVGLLPAVAYFLPFTVPFKVHKVLGAFGADAWFTYAMLAQMMSLNRFVCLFWPVNARMIYTRHNIMIILIFCWIQGFIWSLFYLKPNVAMYFDINQKGFMYDFRFSGTESIFRANTIFNYIHISSLCFIYTLIYAKVRQDRKQILDPNLGNDRKKENKVLIQACIICSMDVAVVATWAVFQKFSSAEYALFIANIVALSSSGSTGYLYILMNSTVRQKLVSMVSHGCCRKVDQRSRHRAGQYNYVIQNWPHKAGVECTEFVDADVML